MTKAKTAGAKNSSKNSSGRNPKPAGAAGQLLFVATPIGNLGDLTLRAKAALEGADVIACEDTRHAQKLLQHYGIKKPLLAYHDHNEAATAAKLITQVLAGTTVAVISDAGLPLIADPGHDVLQQALTRGLEPQVLPGPNAALTALALSGLPTDSFFFAGFLPPKSGARQQRLAALATVPGTLIFYESPARLVAMLADSRAILGNRHAAVARELTKRFETTKRGTLDELATYFNTSPPKGELVVLIDRGVPAPQTENADDLLLQALSQHGIKQAAQIVAAQTGEAVRTLYARALALKSKQR